MQTGSFWRILAVGSALFGIAATGCVDPDGEYDDFKEREKKLAGSGGGTGDGGTCTPPKAADLDGDYLFALASKLGPKLPIVFATKVTATDNSGGTVTMSWKLTPLAYWDRTTPIPPEITFPDSTINADGTFAADPTDVIAVSGDANPLTHGDIEADVSLDGNFCSDATFYCGNVGGKVLKPIPLDLAPGSSWTLEKMPSAGTNPDPIKVNCKGDPADPAPPKA
jgi:hypothetical protein